MRSAAALLLAGTCLSAVTAHAQDATWQLNPGSNNWNTGTNWSAGVVPTGTATFDQSNVTSIFFSPGLTTVETLTFNQNAPAYDFNLCACDEFRITGAGIVNNSASAPVFNNDGLISFRNASTAGNAIINNFSGGDVEFRQTASAGNATINNDGGVIAFNTFSTAGNATINNIDGQIEFRDRSTAGNAIINNDTLGFPGVIFSNQSTAGSARITNSNGGVVLFFERTSAENATIINNDAGSVVFNNRSSAGNATIINNSFFPVGAVAFNNQSTAENATIVTNAGSATLFFDRSNGGNAQFITAAGGVVDFSGTGGPDNLGKISAGSIAGAGDYFLGSNELTVGSNNLSTEVSGTINDGGLCGCATGASLVKIGAGTLILSGLNTYTGPTTVNAGTLIVNGSIAASSLLTVNPGGIVGGIGFLPSTVIAGGTLSPGNSIGTINVVGDLTFTPGSFYSVEVDRTTSDLTNVTGQATLAGTVQVSSPTGAYKFNSPYTILSAVGGLVGQFDAVTGTYVTGVVNNVGNDVLLTLSSNLRGSAGGGVNQQNVAAALDRGFNIAGNNAGFEALFVLPPGSLPNAMSQLSGEVATAVGPAGLEAMSQFLKLMLDPFAGTRGEAGGGPALGFAPERPVSKEAASAYAAYRSILKAPAPALYEPRWTTWAALYGSTSNARGDLGIASHDRDLRIGGVAAGADYRVSPNTVVGFALSGAGANFQLSDGLGTGRGDILQGGVYGATRFDNYYLAASLAASYYDVSTEHHLVTAGESSRTAMHS
jgi:autotransporter-associated beta strand protein